VRALAGALLGLNDGSGEVPRLLSPHREPGRGRNPGEARWMEEVAWCWIHRQKGAGRRIADGVADVARAVHRGAEAVKKCREAWEGRDGKEEVKGELARHREIGAGREPPPYALPDLPEIAERWLAAVEPPRGGEG
jgi:hypothetical protein